MDISAISRSMGIAAYIKAQNNKAREYSYAWYRFTQRMVGRQKIYGRIRAKNRFAGILRNRFCRKGDQYEYQIM